MSRGRPGSADEASAARPGRRQALLLAAVICLAAPACKGTGGKPPPPAKVSDARAAGAPPAPAPRRPPEITDSHVHLTPLPDVVNLALTIFSQVNVTRFAVKSAGVPGTERYEMTRHIADILGEKMAFFTNLDWEGIDDPGWGEREAGRMEQAVKEGASGIKIFKALGLGVRLKDDKLLRLDDPRLEPIWQRAGKVGAIVAWHVADPVAFFQKVDRNNERYEELSMAPDWSFYGKDYPSHDALLAQRDKVVERHPQTTFLGIHFGNYPEDIAYVDRLLSRLPNLYVDTSARLGEIGRHPAEKVRALFIKHQDRILFGTDLILSPRGMQLGSVSDHEPTFADALKFYRDHRRFFETNDRQIDHPTPVQGRWQVDAIGLPPAVLQKFYSGNAERLIFSKRRAWLKAHDAAAAKAKAKAEDRPPAGAPR